MSLRFLFWLVWLGLCQSCWFFQWITFEPFHSFCPDFFISCHLLLWGLDCSYYSRLWGCFIWVIWNIDLFFTWVLITINFSLRTVLVVSHSSGKLCFHFHLIQENFKFLPWFLQWPVVHSKVCWSVSKHAVSLVCISSFVPLWSNSIK